MKKFLCIFVALLMLTSCGGSPSSTSSETVSTVETENVIVEDIAQYTLIIPRKSTIGERDVALLIQETIKEKVGVELPLSLDNKDPFLKEIVIGKTARPQSQTELKYNDFLIKKEGDVIAINGGSAAALEKVVDLFLNQFVTNKVRVPVSYTEEYEYPFENSTVGGVLLCDFAVEGNDKHSNALKNVIASVTGVMPKAEGEHKVYFETDETLGEMQARSEFKDGNIIVYSSGKGVSKEQSAKILTAAFEKATPGEISVDLTQEIPPDNFILATNEVISAFRKTTDERIQEIKNTPNMKIPKGATVYYISNKGYDGNRGTSPNEAWQTTAKLAQANLKAGDYVLFERGGYYRGSFSTRAGVTYSAYGEGEKPIICASPVDGADPGKWTNVSGNIWCYDTPFYKDVGAIVFNHGEAHTTKWLVYKNANTQMQDYRTKTLWDGPETMTNDLDMWHNNSGHPGTDYKVYIYSEENPGKRFKSIEFLQKENAIGCGGNNVTIDNLSIKYTGAHGIGGGTKKNLTVTNCEFHWIGGSIQYLIWAVPGKAGDRPVRYGNAVEIYGGCDGFTVENCYFNQIYDAAVTHQFNFDATPNSMDDNGHYNVTFKDNVMEYCTYSIEFFLGSVPKGNPSYMDNVLYEGNLMWYAGQGLGAQRTDPTQPAHIVGWTHENPAKNFVVKDNLLAFSTAMLVRASVGNKNENGENTLKFENNVVIGEYGQRFGMFGYSVNTFKDYDSSLIDYLEKHSKDNKFYIIK